MWSPYGALGVHGRTKRDHIVDNLPLGVLAGRGFSKFRCSMYVIRLTSEYKGLISASIRAHLADALLGGSGNFVDYDSSGDDWGYFGGSRGYPYTPQVLKLYAYPSAPLDM